MYDEFASILTKDGRTRYITRCIDEGDSGIARLWIALAGHRLSKTELRLIKKLLPDSIQSPEDIACQCTKHVVHVVRDEMVVDWIAQTLPQIGALRQPGDAFTMCFKCRVASFSRDFHNVSDRLLRHLDHEQQINRPIELVPAMVARMLIEVQNMPTLAQKVDHLSLVREKLQHMNVPDHALIDTCAAANMLALIPMIDGITPEEIELYRRRRIEQGSTNLKPCPSCGGPVVYMIDGVNSRSLFSCVQCDVAFGVPIQNEPDDYGDHARIRAIWNDVIADHPEYKNPLVNGRFVDAEPVAQTEQRNVH